MSQTSRSVRVALVGCGRISKNHFDAIANNDVNATLVAVCDIDFKKADTFARMYKVSAYNDYDAMLQRDDIDAIAICTPSGMHAEMGCKAARSGKHVICEKPLALNTKDASLLIEQCAEKKVQLHVVHQNRFNTTIQYLKRALDNGRFGNLYAIQSNVLWSRPQSYYDQDGGWRSTWKMDGGAFMNQAIHYVDSLLYLGGPVKRVAAIAKTIARKIDVPDSGVVSIEFMNGTLGSMHVSMLAYPKNIEGSVTVLGELGTVKIGGVAINKIESWQFSSTNDDDKLVLEQSYETASVYGFGHTGYYATVLNSIQKGLPPVIDGMTGYRAVEMVCAIHQSSQTGMFVNLAKE
ncbi:MAG: Gfo/Idh/MocA family oxidoreductase [Spirochaetes bacterium]|nr:Gfo/Idh/MocA family oxidoreductase [Spirochaetota bacterium]